MSIKNFFVILSLILISGSGSHVVAEKINRQIVDTETLKNNHSIAIVKLELDNAKQEYNKALSEFFPNINLFLHFSRNRSNIYSKYDYLYGLEVNFSIFEGFSKYNYIKEKAAGVKTAEASYNRVVADAVCESNTRYISLMSEYENRELLYEIKKRIERNRDIVKLKYNSGLIDVTALKRAEVDILKVNFNLKAVKRNITLFSALLLKSMGRNDDTVLLETDERVNIYYKKLPGEPNYYDIIVAKPEFFIAQYNFDTCKAQQAEVKGRRLPSFVLSSKYNVNNYNNHLMSMDYKIFSGGQISSDIRIASNNLEIASKNLKNTFDSLKLNAREYYNELVSAWENVNIEEQYVNVLKLKAEISLKKYRNGFLNYEDWYNIENSYINLQIEFLKAKKDVALKSVIWKRFICEK